MTFTGILRGHRHMSSVTERSPKEGQPGFSQSFPEAEVSSLFAKYATVTTHSESPLLSLQICVTLHEVPELLCHFLRSSRIGGIWI